MRKLLLFTCVISFLTVASCSRDVESTEVSLTEKENLVKQTIIEFNNSAIKTGKYNRLVSSVSQKSATGQLSEVELEELVQGFLASQNQAFLDVYYQLVTLNMTAEEFYSIAHQFEHLRLTTTNGLSKGSDCCEASEALEQNGNPLGFLGKFVCGCEEQ
ncbi:hypothetical protein IWQ47_000002 [Aquimarina sp. EL_43]|uniref:hypothetical protein n=1 Tax=unclassified Aquimarina TaxID=2627091 RepID=UPI0018CBC29C|nr:MULTISPECIES: hypothetical protein [unclassified Aquimarina]MBG6129305.1 hypothetical protein [Aquimarina sp. EL_35]MBG6150370.1 hypothetical protein [Aquimarina sp. EL_32]MBG6166944.1 hypothetical protein [Aquimarina sp. EL_43]